MSSRNAYLTVEERRIAPALFASLHRCAIRIRNGALPGEAISEAVHALENAGFKKVEYIEAVDPLSLDPVPVDLPESPCRLIAATWLGKTRLIDNIEL